MIRRSRLGLRDRATLAFGLLGLAVSTVLAISTYLVAERYLVEQRESAGVRAASANARLARSALRSSGTDVAALLGNLRGAGGSEVVLRYEDTWYGSAVGVGRETLPDDLQRTVGAGHVATQRAEGIDGGLVLAAGVPLPAVGAEYYELTSMRELEDTLSVLRTTLLVAAAATSVIAALAGRYAAARVVRPLQPITRAAQAVAAGDLDIRLPTGDDADLNPLTASFNRMTESLQQRIDREVRFASDVSHELRSPLAALAAAVQVLERRRDQLPEAAATAVDVLTDQVEDFQRLVLDLLEISRFDANVVALDVEPVDVRVFLEQLLAGHGLADVEVVVDDAVPTFVLADRRRLAQALGNIVDNAARYADGIVRVSATADPAHITLCFDDAGPGLDPSERTAVFDRFTRGTAGRRAGSTTGTGLGLALVYEHVRLHEGAVRADEAPGGGARFVVELPRREVPAP